MAPPIGVKAIPPINRQAHWRPPCPPSESTTDAVPPVPVGQTVVEPLTEIETETSGVQNLCPVTAYIEPSWVLLAQATTKFPESAAATRAKRWTSATNVLTGNSGPAGAPTLEKRGP